MMKAILLFLFMLYVLPNLSFGLRFNVPAPPEAKKLNREEIFMKRAEQYAANYIKLQKTNHHINFAGGQGGPWTNLVFGKPGWAADACEDIAHANWVKPKNKEDHWFVETKHGDKPTQTYECSGCSARCSAESSYQCDRDDDQEVSKECYGIDKCPTRYLEAQKPKMACDAISRDETHPRKINVAVYGDSHTRVLFFHMWRLLSGVAWPKKLPAWMQLSEAGGDQDEGGFQSHQFSLCEGRLNINLLFHYKTYYYAKPAEADFLQMLQKKNISHDELDLLVVAESIWSTFDLAEPRENWNMTLKSEQEYYLEWVARNFASENTSVIVLSGNAETPTEGAQQTRQFVKTLQRVATENPTFNGCVLDREILARPPDDMICAHGCDGPVPMIQAQAILRSLNGVLTKSTPS